MPSTGRRRRTRFLSGRYDAPAFYDANGDGEPETTLFGIPSEGYGFGNDASAAFGPCDVESAAVTIGDVS